MLKVLACLSVALILATTYSHAIDESKVVTIFEFKGNRFLKIEKSISSKTAEELRSKLEELEKLENPIERLRKRVEILQSYGIFPKNRVLKMVLEELSLKDRRITTDFLIIDFCGVVVGSFHGLTLNFINMGFAGVPLIIESDGGEILDLALFFLPLYLATDNPLFFFSMFFIGVIALIPFVDPDGGEIVGISMMTVATAA